MTKTRIHGHFTPAAARGWKAAARKLISWKMACIAFAFCAATAIASPAQTTFTNLLDFDWTDGSNPYYMALVQGFDGNLYGTTTYGGAHGYGTVFKITPSGTLTTIYNFCAAANCTDGANPPAGLALTPDGDFYGTAFSGGAYGHGVLFKITPSGTLTTLYSFCAEAGCPDGSAPHAPLLLAADGGLYGITEAGGATNNGTVFKISPAGALTTIHSFCSQTNCADGNQPNGGLIQATDGNLYGTASSGGAYGSGVVFKITPSGNLTTLYSFCAEAACADGDAPLAGLVQATDGNFYGTTPSGGVSAECNRGCGTAYKINWAGTLTVLYSFCGCSEDEGQAPVAGLVQATDGNLYGTTYGAIASTWGTVFRITPGGTLTKLHAFNGATDGGSPYSGLVQATNGGLYGATTGLGIVGPTENGTVFALSGGLKPFVETLPTSGKVGRTVIILGNNLTGATSVTFNSTSATFTVVSDTEIKTTVPTGATTGTVEVTTPSGTLKSNVVFHVKS
jgi:uncharacterized repeat protein (TIGR03803 family)